ncbi:MAG: hypothetical protein HQ588_04175 [Deltaproteobacteria bacterium]|nr:hypothetical protein [Deltaproteobacteria bacterium]
MLRLILNELKEHVPFTAIGAVTGIVIMVIIVFAHVPTSISEAAFYTLHPLHVVLSALVTTAIYRRYSRGRLWAAILIGYLGSVGIATLSDAIIPYLEGTALNIGIGFHAPFLETEAFPYLGVPKWVVINSAAVIGIAIGYWKQTTKFPHTGHVLLSTWASLFYFTAFGTAAWLPLLPIIFIFLFLAVWLPCCLSDIVFPLLFIRRVASREDIAYTNHHHGGD